MTDDAVGSGSLELFDVGVEGCDSISTLRAPEMSAMETK
jgi:hypothetical protein